MITEMDQRFSTVNNHILRGVQACNPLSNSFLDEQHLQGLTEHYHVELKCEEVLVAKNYLAHNNNILKDISLHLSR